MSVFDHAEFDNHEQVLFVTDNACGLRGIIAIHSTALGPAAGGCRMHPYPTIDAALTDVLRLSKGMSFKNAMAQLPLGGGKSVVIADPAQTDKHDLLRAFSKHIQRLAGQYWTAIDIGVGPEDADIMAEQCVYIFARASQYEAGFNPSSFTALGGFTGIRAVSTHLFGKDNLSGLRVAIQGLGATGADLAARLHQAGAQLIVSDINDTLLRECCEKYAATAVAPDRIHAQPADIFAPCAMGAVLNDKTIPEIGAKAICGLANNQLAATHHGDLLVKHGIAYVPDYVVNAGGMMGASTVIFDKPDRAAAEKRIRGLFDTILSILKTADEQGVSSADVADTIARSRIANRDCSV